MGFYVSVEPGTDDLVVGNPQLGLSDVESYDLRAEYTFGETGEDLAALSLFYKTIQDPIESIVIRNPLNFESSSTALYRTSSTIPTRPPSRASRSRRARTWASSDSTSSGSSRSAATTLHRRRGGSHRGGAGTVGPLFGVAEGDQQRFRLLEKSRRLFGQPEWIANADISFDHPDWGTKVTLAWFGISSILDAAGSAFIAPNGIPRDYTPDGTSTAMTSWT